VARALPNTSKGSPKRNKNKKFNDANIVTGVVMIGVGTVCMKTAGREEGKLCVVIKEMDDNFVLVTGPKSLTKVKRRRCNIEHLEPLGIGINIKADASDSDVEHEMKKGRVLEKAQTMKIAEETHIPAADHVEPVEKNSAPAEPKPEKKEKRESHEKSRMHDKKEHKKEHKHEKKKDKHEKKAHVHEKKEHKHEHKHKTEKKTPDKHKKSAKSHSKK